MRRIVLPILSLIAVACSSENDDITLEGVNLESDVSMEIRNKAPIIDSKTFTVAEYASEGTSLGAVEVSGTDLSTITYSIACEADLRIDERTGELKTGPDLKLDYETAKHIEFTVSAFTGKTMVAQDFKLVIKDVDEMALLSQDQKELIEYFQYLTLWKAPNLKPVKVTKRWERDMKLHLSGEISDDYKTTIERVVSRYNALTVDGDFNIALVKNSENANAHLFFGTKDEVAAVWPDMYKIIKSGNYSGYAKTPSQNAIISSTRIWISNPIESLLTHELGHALGLGHSNKCEEGKSFLCSKIGADNAILPVEENIIRYLYHKDFKAGLSETEIAQALADLMVNGK